MSFLMRTCVVLVLDLSREDSVKMFHEIFEKLKGLRYALLLAYFIDTGVSNLIPKIKEALLSNLSVPVRIYLSNNYEDIMKALLRDISECAETSAYLVTNRNYGEQILKILKERGVGEINLC